MHSPASPPPYRLLVLTPYPERAAGTRFRVCAYFPWWREANVHAELDAFVDDAFLRDFYATRQAGRKARGLALAAARRLGTAWRARRFDAVFVHRGAAVFGPPVLELALVRALGLPMIFDFDDAVWMDAHQNSRHPLAARLLKNPGKAETLIRLASRVIAGSDYLAAHARRSNTHTSMLRTVVSRDTWKPLHGRLEGAFTEGSQVPVIGWVGTHTTAKQLDLVIPALSELARRGHRFRFRVVGAGRSFAVEGLDVESVDWEQAREVEDFQRIDIGVAPMFSDAWSRGKCGFKQLQYMAVGVPMVATAEGGAREFLQHEENALIAQEPRDWTDQIERLLVDQTLRARLSRAGRHLVESSQCLEVAALSMRDLVLDVVKQAPRHDKRTAHAD